MMTLKEVLSLGSRLTQFLRLFADCFPRGAGLNLARVYVQGLLSDIGRKNCEAIALEFGRAPRTLQRLLESIKWDEEKVRDRCQQIVAREHAHPEAIGLIDGSGIGKSGSETAGVGRQYNGNHGKVENCVVAVHVSYSAPGFRTVLDSRLYLPKDWANDPERRKTHYIPDEIQFQTKQQIALDGVDRARANGIRVRAWTFDEEFGRDSKFLDGLEDRQQVFVGEIPQDTHAWTSKPRVIRRNRGSSKKGRAKKVPRVRRRPPSCEVRNLLKYSPVFHEQSWQTYRIKDTERGAEVWEVKHALVWRKTAAGLPSRQHTLLVARNVRTGEIKYFLCNRAVGRAGVTVRWLLRVAFGRWAIEACFRTAKEELGMDHFEVRGWRCIHRHYYLAGLSFLFCSRVRQELDPDDTGQLTIEQVRRAMNAYLEVCDLPLALRKKKLQKELDQQAYYQTRNAQAKKSHTKTRTRKYWDVGIDIDKIKSCIPRTAA